MNVFALKKYKRYREKNIEKGCVINGIGQNIQNWWIQVKGVQVFHMPSLHILYLQLIQNEANVYLFSISFVYQNSITLGYIKLTTKILILHFLLNSRSVNAIQACIGILKESFRRDLSALLTLINVMVTNVWGQSRCASWRVYSE